MIALDKQAHFLFGYAAAVTICTFSMPAGLVFVLLAAAGKEYYDFRHPENHTADKFDALYTVGGGAAGALFVLMAPTVKHLIGL